MTTQTIYAVFNSERKLLEVFDACDFAIEYLKFIHRHVEKFTLVQVKQYAGATTWTYLYEVRTPWGRTTEFEIRAVPLRSAMPK